jgi:hypothetical protein
LLHSYPKVEMLTDAELENIGTWDLEAWYGGIRDQARSLNRYPVIPFDDCYGSRLQHFIVRIII